MWTSLKLKRGQRRMCKTLDFLILRGESGRSLAVPLPCAGRARPLGVEYPDMYSNTDVQGETGCCLSDL